MKVTRLTVIKDKLWNVCRTSGLSFLFCGFLGFFLTGKKAVLIKHAELLNYINVTFYQRKFQIYEKNVKDYLSYCLKIKKKLRP
jgi:hypothetical protein